jgi:hypothetical protein
VIYYNKDQKEYVIIINGLGETSIENSEFFLVAKESDGIFALCELNEQGEIIPVEVVKKAYFAF